MLAAISSAVSAITSARPTTTDGYFWFRLPDVSDEIAAKITKASAWMAWTAIGRCLHDRKRRGRTEAERTGAANGRAGVGLHALARSVKCDVGTMRRQCRRLAELGLIVIHSPSRLDVRDPVTGKIVSKTLGRCRATVIFLTVSEVHQRPDPSRKPRLAAVPDGGEIPPSPCPDKVESAPTSRERKNHTTPDGQTAGVCLPQAEGSAGLTAVEAGGHPAAKAGQEGVAVVEVGPGRQGILVNEGTPTPTPCTPRRPGTPGGGPRLRVHNGPGAGSKGRRPSPTPSGSPPVGMAGDEGYRPPQTFTGKDLDAFEAVRRRLDAERAAREAADTSPPVFGQGTPTFVQEAKRLEGRPADELADELRQAAAQVTRKQRRKAAKAADSVPIGDPGLKALLEAVEKKRQAMQDNEQDAKAVAKERYRVAYRREIAGTT